MTDKDKYNLGWGGMLQSDRDTAIAWVGSQIMSKRGINPKTASEDEMRALGAEVEKIVDARIIGPS